jgi:hypothetical protein
MIGYLVINEDGGYHIDWDEDNFTQPKKPTVEEVIKSKIKGIILEFVDHTAYGPGELTGVDEAAQAITDLYGGEKEEGGEGC